MSQNIVHIENLVKRYGELVALNHLNLDIREGESRQLSGKKTDRDRAPECSCFRGTDGAGKYRLFLRPVHK